MMTPFGQKRLVVWLSTAAVCFAVLAAWGWVRTIMGEVHATLSDGWSEMLKEGKDAAVRSHDPHEVADYLRWIGRFYRPPEPPTSGIERRHYNMVERVRVCYQRDIVIHLRELTGDQLGEDPKVWVQKYAKPEK